MKNTAAILVAITMMTFVSSVQAEGKPPRDNERKKMPPRGREEMGRGPGGRPDKSLIERFISNPNVVKKLGLSDDQVELLKSSSDQTKIKLAELQEAMREAGKKQAQQITADNLDEQAVMEAVEEVGRIRTEMAKLRTRDIMMLKKLMTPEQREQLKKVMKHQRQGGKGSKGGKGESGEKADRESGSADMERRREQMKEKMAERRKERQHKLESEEQE
jgi:Spy/CpxP family protein refolding chaperone